MDQTLHETGKPKDRGKGELRVKTDGRPRKSKRKAKRGLRLNALNFMLLLVAVQSAQIGAVWALHSASQTEMRGIRSEMNTGFERLDVKITAVETGLRADMASMEDELRAEIASVETELRTEIASAETGLRTEIASVETGLRTELSGLRDDVTGLTERVARIEAVIIGMPAEGNEPTEGS